ncbi:dynein regulatory complex subunit 4-like [Boleophthalmus pectinirostris]|uniref:dynein regulatory complex subunit 4-like n=1 Tax=Boleophthalmus pectinirostris TaxID=150288 RepID=UPI0024326359|nr:dynein regulatory complex subunit 4-like [Boleophthalmus pectinirostris]
MSAAKEEQLYVKQLRHLQDKIRRYEESIEQKKKNFTTNKAKCIPVEQDTKAIREYLEFDLARKPQHLAELLELYKQQIEKSRRELEEIDEKNNQKLQKLYDLKELTTELSKNESKHAEVLNDLQIQVQSHKDRLAKNQKNHKAKIAELQDENLDAEMVARYSKFLKDTDEDLKHNIRDNFISTVKDEREYHQTGRNHLVLLRDIAQPLREERDDLVRQLIQDQENMMEAEQELYKITAANKIQHQKTQKLQDTGNNRMTEVKDLEFSVEDRKRNMKCTQDLLLQKMATITATCQKQKEIDLLKAVIELEHSRATELSEGSQYYFHIIEEPKMDLWKLRRLLAILESYTPQQTF